MCCETSTAMEWKRWVEGDLAAARMVVRAASSLAGEREMMIMEAPFEESCWAAERPRPSEPPVMRIV